MSKHTPGKWNEDPFEGGSILSLLPVGKYRPVCRLEDSDEREANANLIAAAPELLDIARMMLERLEDARALWESPEEHEIEMEIYRKAIAKAEGRE